MKIITQTAPGKQTEFEQDYIYNFILKNATSIDSDKRVIVYSSNRREVIPSGISSNDVLVHLSNENLKYNYHFTSSSNIVFRSYYHPFLWKNITGALILGLK